MKKLLSVLAVAGFLVACNNTSETTSTTDSTSATVDSATPMTAPMDTTMKMDTSKRGKADSAIRK